MCTRLPSSDMERSASTPQLGLCGCRRELLHQCARGATLPCRCALCRSEVCRRRLLPERDSAFHRVVPRPRGAISEPQHTAYSYNKKELCPFFEGVRSLKSEPLDLQTSRSSYVSLKCESDSGFSKDLEGSRSTTYFELPLKKRITWNQNSLCQEEDTGIKDDSQIDSYCAQKKSSLDQTINNVTDDTLLGSFSQISKVSSSTDFSFVQPYPAGKFVDWSCCQVQIWLRKVLSGTVSELSLSCLLQMLDGKSGSELATYCRQNLQTILASGKLETELDVLWKVLCAKIESDAGYFLRDANQKLKEHDLSDTESSTSSEFVVPLSPEVKGAVENRWGNSQSASPKRKRKKRGQGFGQLWQFIQKLLMDPTYSSVICWEDKSKKLFRILDTEEIARLWGKHKGNSKMTYANMSRTMRYYQEGNGAFIPDERKTVYGFGPKANFERLQ